MGLLNQNVAVNVSKRYDANIRGDNSSIKYNLTPICVDDMIISEL